MAKLQITLFLALLIWAFIVFTGRCTSEKTPILIGATMSETGNLATQGQAAKNGYLLCEQHVNEDGGVLGRPISFRIYDDQSDTGLATVLYDQLISIEGVDLVMGPYGSTLTEAVAPVTERYRMVHISPLAATTSIWEQGREFLFMVLPPAELFLAGVIELAAGEGLEHIAVLQEDALFPKAAGAGAVQLARELGINVVFHETYPRNVADFSEYLTKIRQEGVQVLAMAASTLNDFVRITKEMKATGTNLSMFGTSGAVAEYEQSLGTDAEYTYGLSAWEPALQNPGMDRFVRDYQDRFGMMPSFHAAGAYGSCELLVKAIRKTGNLNQEALRRNLLEMETQTVFSSFKVDQRGYQLANAGLLIQWQDGGKEIVWPEHLATSSPRFPTPAWADR